MISKPAAKEWFMRYIMSLLNTPYLWGGDDPMSGFDCSGMVVEGLKSVGGLGYKEDCTANDLWFRFKKHHVADPRRGCLAFWFRGDRAIHVAVCLTHEICITADSGGSGTLTLKDARKQNAFIKFRPIDHRLSEPKFIDLFGVD